MLLAVYVRVGNGRFPGPVSASSLGSLWYETEPVELYTHCTASCPAVHSLQPPNTATVLCIVDLLALRTCFHKLLFHTISLVLSVFCCWPLLTLSFIIYLFFSPLLFFITPPLTVEHSAKSIKALEAEVAGPLLFWLHPSILCCLCTAYSSFFLSLLSVLCLQCLYFCISGVHCDKSSNLLLSVKSFCSHTEKSANRMAYFMLFPT